MSFRSQNKRLAPSDDRLLINTTPPPPLRHRTRGCGAVEACGGHLGRAQAAVHEEPLSPVGKLEAGTLEGGRHGHRLGEIEVRDGRVISAYLSGDLGWDLGWVSGGVSCDLE